MMTSTAGVGRQPSMMYGFVNLVGPFSSLVRGWGLIRSMARREIQTRFVGTSLGWFWTLLSPLIMLVIYSFIFGVVFRGRWQQQAEGNLGEFAVILFCGISTFGIFNECIMRAPGLVISNANLVKKVVFPLETLALSQMGAAIFQGTVNLMLVLIANFLITGKLHWTIVIAPIVIVALVMFTLGVVWILASLGVFFRDIQQLIGLLSSALFFLTPIFYSPDALPEALRGYAMLNPLAQIVEAMRSVLLWGKVPEPSLLLFPLLSGWCVMQIGYAFFMRTKPAFADVI